MDLPVCCWERSLNWCMYHINSCIHCGPLTLSVTFVAIIKIFFMKYFFLLAVSCCLWLASQFSSLTVWIMTSFLPTSLSITLTHLKSHCLMPSCRWMSAMPGKGLFIILTVPFVRRWQFYCWVRNVFYVCNNIYRSSLDWVETKATECLMIFQCCRHVK